MIYIMALVCGILFGIGLTISNMINANKVLDFLDFFGNWDPSLAFVMFGAILVAWIIYKIAMRQSKPKLATEFHLPQKTSIDRKLIVGSMIFGVGWGLAGYCPGPAISALGLGIMDAVYFVLGMLISIAVMFVGSIFSKR